MLHLLLPFQGRKANEVILGMPCKGRKELLLIAPPSLVVVGLGIFITTNFLVGEGNHAIVPVFQGFGFR